MKPELVTEMDRLVNEAVWGGVAPAFCSIDEVVDEPADWGDPVAFLIRKEDEVGIPLVFQREVDDTIRFARLK